MPVFLSFSSLALLRRSRAVLVAAGILAIAVTAQACSGDSGPTPTASSSGTDGTISVELINFEFRPKRLSFEMGESVKFRLASMDEPHTFTVMGLDINWTLTRDDPQVQTYTFEEPGTFRLVCQIPGHEGLGMVGTVEVR